MSRIIVFVLLSFIAIFSSPAAATEPPQLIRASSEKMPDWVMKNRKAFDYVYFTGMSAKTTELKDSKKQAVDDALSQLVQYIGFRATSKFQSKKEMSDSDNISSFKNEVVQTIEGKGSANVNIDIEDTYYENYSDNTYSMYVLIKFPTAWVEKERKRLQTMVAEQRKKASGYLKEANEDIQSGKISKALDLALGAYSISEKASENSDLNDESKSLIEMIFGSLSLSLENKPSFAYTEGGSEPIKIKVFSSKTGLPAGNFALSSWENNSNALVEAKKGNNSDSNGIIEYEVRKIFSSSTNEVFVGVSFSLARLESIKKSDEEFYSRILKIQSASALQIELSITKKDKTLPTGIFVLAIKRGGVRAIKGQNPKFQESISGKMANLGFNIISTEITPSYLEKTREDGLKETILSSFKKKYPSVKRLLLAIQEINLIGKIGKDIKFKNYDINDSGIIVVEMKLSLSLIEVSSSKVEKGLNLSEKGQGLNPEQATGIAEKRILEKLETQLDVF
jgi:hypothetical protein